MLRALPEATHTAVAGVSQGQLGLHTEVLDFQPHTQLFDLSGNSVGYRGDTVADFPQLAPWPSPKTTYSKRRPTYFDPFL